MPESGPRPDLVLFDLDGTLIQSREAAWTHFADISARHGLPFTSAEEFHTIFAGNFSEGLRRACADESTFQQVKAEYFSVLEREYTPPLVPGMREVVTHLAERTTLGVVSSNVLKVVRRVLESNDIATCIAHVFTGDINPSKRDVITTLRANSDFTLGRHCSPYYDESQASRSPSTGAVYLVTDTVGDCEEALAAGAIPIGVAWGMHSERQLRQAGAGEVCLWPQELIALLGQGPRLGSCAPSRPGTGAAAPSRGTDILDRVRAANGAPVGVQPSPGTPARAGCCGSCTVPSSGPSPAAARAAEVTGDDPGGPARGPVGVDPEVLAAVTRTGGR